MDEGEMEFVVTGSHLKHEYRGHMLVTWSVSLPAEDEPGDDLCFAMTQKNCFTADGT